MLILTRDREMGMLGKNSGYTYIVEGVAINVHESTIFVVLNVSAGSLA